MTYELGSVVRIGPETFTDINGAPVDPTTVQLVVKKPDGTSDTYAGVRQTLGVFYYDYAPATAGTYYYKWTTTGTAYVSDVGTFQVQDTFTTPVWSYGDPSTSDKDTIRFLLGDTDPADPLLTDAGILFLLTQWSDVYSAAAAGAEQIAGQFAREVANSGDGVGVDFSALQDKYMALAGQLRKLSKRIGRAAVPYVGGISRSETERALLDTDLVTTMFSTGMHDDNRDGAAAIDARDQLLSDQRFGGAGT